MSARSVSLASGVALLLAGAYEVVGQPGATVLTTAGLVTLGAWLAIEVWHHRDIQHKHHDDKGE